MKHFSLILGLFLLVACEKNDVKTIYIPSDSTAIYEVLYLIDEGEYKILATNRHGKSGNSYSKIKVDCEKQKYQGLGEGETLAEMETPRITKDFYEVVGRSIKYYQVNYACSDKG